MSSEPPAPSQVDHSDVLQHSPVEVVFGSGRLGEIGSYARQHGAAHVLLVTDPGIVKAGHADRARAALVAAGLAVTLFDGTRENPTTAEVDRGVALAKRNNIDFVIGLGGGSSMDCAKGVNLILTNGGVIANYWGIDKASAPLLPMILAPTTAGTGSEAQSFALISDATTRRKMACGVQALPTAGGLRPRVAILDPELTASQPPEVARAVGIDAIAHTVETAGCSTANDVSRAFSQRAWSLLAPAYPLSLNGADDETRAHMLIGAHLAGCAIECSMLGAAHACANPLTASHGVVHGVAVGLMLPHVVAFNCRGGVNPYASIEPDAKALVATLETMLTTAGLPTHLYDLKIPRSALPGLAERASREWTAQFNPREVGVDELLRVYEAAF